MIATTVNQCTATDCAYNDDRACRALAITVGEPSAHTCATYEPKQKKVATQVTVANVGACKASNCIHNAELSCKAAEVTIGMESGQVRCMTFESK
ncbi:MAG: DUF1540 domain-containing protein [Candidatus Sumerlaeia bacterium]|nr:DUF1540 domain-containing protein [Candidatus Sumerlaeia bacterium]